MREMYLAILRTKPEARLVLFVRHPLLYDVTVFKMSGWLGRERDEGGEAADVCKGNFTLSTYLERAEERRGRVDHATR